jgi:hypothetical protein
VRCSTRPSPSCPDQASLVALLIVALTISLAACAARPPNGSPHQASGTVDDVDVAIIATSCRRIKATLQYEVPISIHLSRTGDQATLGDFGTDYEVRDPNGVSEGSIALVQGSDSRRAVLLVDKVGAPPTAIVFDRPVILIQESVVLSADSLDGLRGMTIAFGGIRLSVRTVEDRKGSVGVSIVTETTREGLWAPRSLYSARFVAADRSFEISARSGFPQGASWVEGFVFSVPDVRIDGPVSLEVLGPQMQLLRKARLDLRKCARDE